MEEDCDARASSPVICKRRAQKFKEYAEENFDSIANNRLEINLCHTEYCVGINNEDSAENSVDYDEFGTSIGINLIPFYFGSGVWAFAGA